MGAEHGILPVPDFVLNLKYFLSFRENNVHCPSSSKHKTAIKGNVIKEETFSLPQKGW